LADDQHPASEPESAPDEPGAAGAADGVGPADPYGTPTDPYEGAVPPGYDWPTHGGYLGCLMGLVAACLLAGFVGSFVIGLISVTPVAVLVSTSFARIALLVLSFAICFGALGSVGWKLGKRFYREYPQPTPRDSAEPPRRAADDQAPAEHERIV
jgi:hypothetical protein